MPMQIDEVINRTTDIQSLANQQKDYEAASDEEHKLWAEFIALVANSAPPPLADIAKVLLTTAALDFPRW